MLTTAAAIVGGGITSQALGQQDKDEDAAPSDGLSLADRRFRWVFLRALKIQRRRGKIDAKRYRRLTIAAWSGMPIAGKTALTTPRPFIGHLRRSVTKKQVAGGIFDIFDGFEFSFDGMLTWLLENWQLVLRIAIGLLVFLDAAENNLD